MAITVTNSQTDEGITIPYPAFYRHGRTNFGFIDTRGRSDLAAAIAEAAGVAALKRMLCRLAEDQTPVFSVGCDIGHRTDLTMPSNLQQAAGGYVSVVSALYNRTRPQDWARLFNDVSRVLEEAVGLDEWMVHFELAPIAISLDDFEGMTGSVNIRFDAFGPSLKKAATSRERLIHAIDSALSERAVKNAFSAGPKSKPDHCGRADEAD